MPTLSPTFILVALVVALLALLITVGVLLAVVLFRGNNTGPSVAEIFARLEQEDAR